MTCQDETPPPLRASDEGTVLRRRVRAETEDGAVRAFDLAGASVVFRFTDPAGISTDVPADVLDAPRGLCGIVTELGLLAVVGVWQWSVIVSSAAGTWESEAVDLEVSAGLPAPA